MRGTRIAWMVALMVLGATPERAALDVVAVALPEGLDVVEGTGIIGVGEDAFGEEALGFADCLGAVFCVRDSDCFDDGAGELGVAPARTIVRGGSARCMPPIVMRPASALILVRILD